MLNKKVYLTFSIAIVFIIIIEYILGLFFNFNAGNIVINLFSCVCLIYFAANKKNFLF